MRSRPIPGGCQFGLVDRAATAGPCRVDCLHRSGVAGYRDAKALADEARKLAREAAPYDPRVTDMTEWDAANPPLTFKRWLQDRRSEVLTDPTIGDRFVDMDENLIDTDLTPLDAELMAMSTVERDAWLDEYDADAHFVADDTVGLHEWRDR